MCAADRCGFDVGSLKALNDNRDEIAQEDRWTLNPLDRDQDAFEAWLDDLYRPIGVMR